MSADLGFNDADETGSTSRASLREVEAIRGVGLRDLSTLSLPNVGNVFCVSVLRLASRWNFLIGGRFACGVAKSTAETRGLSVNG